MNDISHEFEIFKSSIISKIKFLRILFYNGYLLYIKNNKQIHKLFSTMISYELYYVTKYILLRNISSMASYKLYYIVKYFYSVIAQKKYFIYSVIRTKYFVYGLARTEYLVYDVTWTEYFIFDAKNIASRNTWYIESHEGYCTMEYFVHKVARRILHYGIFCW